MYRRQYFSMILICMQRQSKYKLFIFFFYRKTERLIIAKGKVVSLRPDQPQKKEQEIEIFPLLLETCNREGQQH